MQLNHFLQISVWNTIFFLISPVYYLRGRCTLTSMETNGRDFSSTGLWVLWGQVKLGVNWLRDTCHHVISWNLFKDDVEIECGSRHARSDLNFPASLHLFLNFFKRVMHPYSWFSPQYTLFCRVMDMSRQDAIIWTKTVVLGFRDLFKWATRYCLVDPWLHRQKQTRHNMSSNFASSRYSVLFASFVTIHGINLQTFHE